MQPVYLNLPLRSRDSLISKAVFQSLLITLIDPVIPPQRLRQRVRFRLAKAEVQMPPPAFGVLKTTRHAPELQRLVFHRQQVGIETLADIQPALLALVLGQRVPLGLMDGGSVY